MLDLILKNGCLVDPSNGFHGEMQEIGIANGRIAVIEKSISQPAKAVTDLKSHTVTPGLIDFHAHYYSGGTNTALEYSRFAASGVTNAVDAGSAGTANFESFLNALSQQERRNTRQFLNVSPEGLTPLGDHPENINPKYYNARKIISLCEQYKGEIVGLKIRISKDVADFSATTGFEALRAAVALGDKVNLPISVHMPDFEGELSELIDILRPGDIFCHVFTPKKGILENGKVSAEIFRGREKGILFESACGKGHFGHQTARLALETGFLPDIISGDFTRATFGNAPAHSLPYLMSRFMALGMSFEEVLATVTTNPAHQMRMEGEVGCLKVGSRANLTVLDRREGNYSFTDVLGGTVVGKELLVPLMTLVEGEKLCDFLPA